MSKQTDSMFVKVVEAQDWIIGFFSGYPLMASFKHQDEGDEDMPRCVSEWYCSICANEDREGSQDGEAHCSHKALLAKHDPNGTDWLSPAELDNDDDWEAWRDYQAEKRAASRGLS